MWERWRDYKSKLKIILATCVGNDQDAWERRFGLQGCGSIYLPGTGPLTSPPLLWIMCVCTRVCLPACVCMWVSLCVRACVFVGGRGVLVRHFIFLQNASLLTPCKKTSKTTH